MKPNRDGGSLSDIALGILRGISRWFLGVIGVCIIAGGIGTVAGLFLGFPLAGALVGGGLAIAVVLGVYLFLISDGF